jgi:hypothetical protein
VILFCPVSNKQVKYLSGSAAYMNELFLKAAVLIIVFMFLGVLENNTRVENFHKLDKRSKQ